MELGSTTRLPEDAEAGVPSSDKQRHGMVIDVSQSPFLSFTFGATITDAEWTEYHRVLLAEGRGNGPPLLLLNDHLAGGLPPARGA
jgi:hypothetical protein